MSGISYEQLAMAERVISFSDMNSANAWFSQNDVYISSCSFNKKNDITIRYIALGKPVNYVYGMEMVTKVGVIKKGLESYKKKWMAKNPDKQLCSISSSSIVFGQNGSSLIGVGLVEQKYYILYKTRKKRNTAPVAEMYFANSPALDSRSSYNRTNYNNSLYDMSQKQTMNSINHEETGGMRYVDNNNMRYIDENNEDYVDHMDHMARVDIKRCSYCRNMTAPGARFCEYCGQKIEG